MNKNKNIPRLRFLEFKNSPEWSIDCLINLTDVLRCGIAATPEYVGEGVIFLSSQNVTNDGKFTLDKFNYISNEFYKKISKTAKLLKGDILYSRVGSGYGNATVFPYDGNYGVYVSLTHIRVNKKLNNIFLNYLLNSPFCKVQSVSGVFQGGGVPNLNVKIVEKFQIKYPSKPEQEKIAECLSSIDALITAQTDKIAAFKERKKGLMQKIFPQDGETTPRYRFLEFRNSPSWTDVTLGDIAVFFKGKNISKSDVVVDGMTECIRYGELYTHYKETIKEICSKTNLDKSTLIFSEYNDIIIPASGETQIDIATASCVLKKGVALGGDLNIIRSPLNGTFLSYYLNAIKKGEIAALAQGNSVVHLYISQLQKLIITYPELVEQEKIAEFLSSLDELISLHTEKLSALKEHKKGLMQQLFPAVEKE